MKFRPLVGLAAVVVVSACASTSAPESTYDPAAGEMSAWRAAQTEQECPDVPQDPGAVDLVRTTQDSGDVTRVYGEDDPYDRVRPVQKHLHSRPNAAGEGTIVTAVRDGKTVGFNETGNTRHRAVWLVLDGMAYPLNVEAAGAHGLLSSGLPVDVAIRAGLSQHAIDTGAELGIDEFISYDWGGDDSPLPDCEGPTGSGGAP